MIVISDTSVITSLLNIDYIHILKHLYKEVYIPTAVKEELLKEHILLPDFINVLNVKDKEYVEKLLNELDRGESEAIVLAKEIKADLLIIDEKIGGNIAEREGIRVIGILGILVICKKCGIITSIKDVIQKLEKIA